MSEDREYGLEDGYSDGTSGREPQIDLASTDGGEYEIAYVEAYNRALREQDELSS